MNQSEKARRGAIDKVSKIVLEDRNSEYGDPEDNFQDIADYWNIYLQKKLKVHLSAVDVTVMNALQKVSRLQNSPLHEDSMIDIAGYGLCGVGCQKRAIGERENLDVTDKPKSMGGLFSAEEIEGWHDKIKSKWEGAEPVEVDTETFDAAVARVHEVQRAVAWREAEKELVDSALRQLREASRSVIEVGDYVVKRDGRPFYTAAGFPKMKVRVDDIFVGDNDGISLVLEDGYGVIAPGFVRRLPKDKRARPKDDPLGR